MPNDRSRSLLIEMTATIVAAAFCSTSALSVANATTTTTTATTTTTTTTLAAAAAPLAAKPTAGGYKTTLGNLAKQAKGNLQKFFANASAFSRKTRRGAAIELDENVFNFFDSIVPPKPTWDEDLLSALANRCEEESVVITTPSSRF